MVGFDTEAEEFVVGEAFAEVGFIKEEEEGLPGLEGVFRDSLVAVVGILRGVEREQDDVRNFDSVGDLVLDAGFEIVGRVLEAGGVDEEKTIVDARDDIIAGRSLFAGDDGDVFVCKAVKQAGFAGVSLTD